MGVARNQELTGLIHLKRHMQLSSSGAIVGIQMTSVTNTYTRIHAKHTRNTFTPQILVHIYIICTGYKLLTIL